MLTGQLDGWSCGEDFEDGCWTHTRLASRDRMHQRPWPVIWIRRKLALSFCGFTADDKLQAASSSFVVS